ncbi:MAG TPA: hypothetical protein DD990_22135 [Cyanobacteria bacterium UBA11368]|nr:hypothetical protein [Cyanobacteria bacterium UBA11368]
MFLRKKLIMGHQRLGFFGRGAGEQGCRWDYKRNLSKNYLLYGNSYFMHFKQLTRTPAHPHTCTRVYPLPLYLTELPYRWLEQGDLTKSALNVTKRK